LRSLVIQTSFIGDVVLTTPLIARLAQDGDVDVVTTAVGATLLASHPAVSRLFVYDNRA
jgi:heptosyltransferase-2